MVYKCINQPVWLDCVCVNIWTRSLYATFLNTRISSKWESVLELYLFFGAFLPVHLLPIQRFLQRFWTTCLLINSENIHIHFGNIDTQQTQCCFINRLHSVLLGVFHHAALLCFWKQTSGKFLLLLQLNSFNEIICQPPCAAYQTESVHLKLMLDGVQGCNQLQNICNSEMHLLLPFFHICLSDFSSNTEK